MKPILKYIHINKDEVFDFQNYTKLISSPVEISCENTVTNGKSVLGILSVCHNNKLLMYIEKCSNDEMATVQKIIDKWGIR